MSDHEDRLMAWQIEVAEAIPGILPPTALLDLWDGASGIEETPGEPYMAMIHEWDRDFTWCSLMAWQRGVPAANPIDVHPDLIPGWIYKRAIGIKR